MTGVERPRTQNRVALLLELLSSCRSRRGGRAARRMVSGARRLIVSAQPKTGARFCAKASEPSMRSGLSIRVSIVSVSNRLKDSSPSRS